MSGQYMEDKVKTFKIKWKRQRFSCQVVFEARFGPETVKTPTYPVLRSAAID